LTQGLTFGLAAGNVIKPILLDALGNVLVYGKPPTSSALPFLVDAANRLYVRGFNDGILDAYSTRVARYYENLNLLAGLNTIDFEVVPPGYIFKLTAFWFRYSVLIAANQVRVSLNDGVTDYVFINVLGPAANVGYSFLTDITLRTADFIRLVITAAAVGNDIFFSYLGYSMPVP